MAKDMQTAAATITIFENEKGKPLTKTLALGDDGKLIKTPAAAMSKGRAQVVSVADGASLKTVLDSLKPPQALCLGVPSDDQQTAQIVRVSDVKAGGKGIARSQKFFHFPEGREGWLLIDVDLGAAPAEIAQRIRQEQVLPLLAQIIPEFVGAEVVARKSTSAVLRNGTTGAEIAGSDGSHIYVRVADASDIPRATKALFERCQLAGFGWIILSKSGARLERGLVDASVGSPERLVFEGAPVLLSPVEQSPEDRAAVHRPGGALDTRSHIPDLDQVERQNLKTIVAIAKRDVADEAGAVAEAFTKSLATQIADDTGLPLHEARQRVERLRSGILTDPVTLAMDDGAEVRIGQILEEPERYHLATCADPIEGVAYGTCKAKIYNNSDTGDVIINSQAHGGGIYRLLHNPESVRAIINTYDADTPPEDKAAAVRRIVAAMLRCDLDPLTEDELKCEIVAKNLTTKRPLNTIIKRMTGQLNQQRHRQRQNERQRGSQLPEILAPDPDGPLTGHVAQADQILAACTSLIPPMRTVDLAACTVRERSPAGMHMLTDEDEAPPPEPLITELTTEELHMQLERHVSYYVFVPGGDGPPRRRDVRLPAAHTRALMTYQDSAMPRIKGIVTTPFLTAKGSLIHGNGLNRETGLFFNVSRVVSNAIPEGYTPTVQQAAKAYSWLTDTWLQDVETTAQGKAVLIAMALTVIQRVALPQRPAFMVRASQRGGGKSTVINMISAAVLGRVAAAMAWADNVEERTKALLPILSDGVALAGYDNLPRGSAIDCPVINNVLTQMEYKARILGKSEDRTVPTTTIFVFNGNNVAPSGDFASRCLVATIESKQADPENRPFHTHDPIGWTHQNRAQILHCLYTILLSNRRRFPREDGQPHPEIKTRFKVWQHLIGAPLEELTFGLSFADLFAENEEGNEETNGLIKLLDGLKKTFEAGSYDGRRPGEFTAKDLADAINLSRDAFKSEDFRLHPSYDHIDDIVSGIADATSPLPPAGSLQSFKVGSKLAAVVGQVVTIDGVPHRLILSRNARHINYYKVEAMTNAGNTA